MGIKLLVPLFVIFSLFLLFRGHNAPGGGFVGGLVFSIAFSLYTLNYGVKRTKEKYKIIGVEKKATPFRAGHFNFNKKIV
jgi:multisubunit Na+/H+ antiporter MnhB subunit